MSHEPGEFGPEPTPRTDSKRLTEAKDELTAKLDDARTFLQGYLRGKYKSAADIERVSAEWERYFTKLQQQIDGLRDTDDPEELAAVRRRFTDPSEPDGNFLEREILYSFREETADAGLKFWARGEYARVQSALRGYRDAVERRTGSAVEADETIKAWLLELDEIWNEIAASAGEPSQVEEKRSRYGQKFSGLLEAARRYFS